MQSGRTDNEADADANNRLVSEQVDRMDEIINHQLQRAAVSGRSTLAKPVPVGKVVERLLRSLDKVYRDKQVTVELALDTSATFTGDEADLTEILGNLLENAYKYCRHTVQVQVSTEQRAGESRSALQTTAPALQQTRSRRYCNAARAWMNRCPARALA